MVPTIKRISKGVGEMATNSPIPPIVNAINNSLGLRIKLMLVMPLAILRALDENATQVT